MKMDAKSEQRFSGRELEKELEECPALPSTWGLLVNHLKRHVVLDSTWRMGGSSGGRERMASCMSAGILPATAGGGNLKQPRAVSATRSI